MSYSRTRDSQQMDRILLRTVKYETCRDTVVLDYSQPPEENLQPILREEVEIALASLKKGKSAEVDDIPAEFLKLVGIT